MYSFSCQICGVDMAIARIRTSDEPPSAAWDMEGANYVGFSRRPWGDEAQDQECQDCTTADRTPADPQILHLSRPLWPDREDEDDAEWLPDSDTDDEPLEYDPGSEIEGPSGHQRGAYDEPCRHDGGSDGSDRSDRDNDTTTEHIYPLSELCDPPRPERLPHGTWYKGIIYYTGNRRSPVWGYFPGDGMPKVPPEHIASSSCQSVQGINGNVLSIAQMKNCRNVRYLVPKPKDWKAEESDRLLEEESLFYLSGESNGSNLGVDRYFLPWHSFHPPRHGLRELRTSWEFVGEGCDESDVLYPLAAHSYCIDMYAKASYLKLGRVDLDGLWHWREIQSNPDSYGVGERISLQRQEVKRAREGWDCPWRHLAGDEWLVANPVEIPGIHRVWEMCKNHINDVHAQRPDTGFLALPTEIIQHTISFLDVAGVDALAKTCRTLYHHAQPAFKAFVLRDMGWLWEIPKGSEYPASRDWPVTWDPLCPPGLEPPTLPVGLESEEAEEALWAEIISEDPEMEEAGNAAKMLNRLRRDEIMAPYRARQKVSLDEWHRFRAGVEAWIRRPRSTGVQHDRGDLDWRHLYWLCNPTTTPIPGLRNRARIWDDCGQILDCVSIAHDRGEIERRRGTLDMKLSDPSQPGWSTDLDADDF